VRMRRYYPVPSVQQGQKICFVSMHSCLVVIYTIFPILGRLEFEEDINDVGSLTNLKGRLRSIG
jgi:alpha-glucuronidase